MAEITESRFLSDVANHKMSVLHDDGVFRCVRFAQEKDSWYMAFALTTWPGHLCISGDMGTFVFSRVPDMFEFFRVHPDWDKGKIHINPSYWHEKVLAQDRHTPCVKYDADQLEGRCLDAWRSRFELGDDVDPEKAPELAQEAWDEMRSQILSADNIYEAHENLRNFEHNGWELNDTWEWDLESWGAQYLWCCYAIVWGISQYDTKPATQPAST